MKTEQLLDDATKTLRAANSRFGWQGDEDEQAWELLTHARGGKEPDWDEDLSASVQRSFQRLVKRRMTGEPIAFIVGWVDFRDFRLGIKPGMFVPRSTSEFLAAQAIRRLSRRLDPVHVDLATGIGPVAISSARAVSHARVWGLDISAKALAQARVNAAALDLSNVTFRRSDLFANLPASLRGEVDVVTIHPPYVARTEMADLPVEIKKFEPKHTLSDGSVDGLGLVRRAIADSTEWIRPGGWFLMEIVPGEFNSIRPLLRDAGFIDIRSTRGPHEIYSRDRRACLIAGVPACSFIYRA